MSTWDTIVVGAGSAGAVIATRLTEDPNHRVLLIEAGGSDRKYLYRKPGMMSIMHVVPQVKKQVDWGFRTAPNQATNGRSIPYVRGKAVGGSSAVNGMVFVRGNRANYDDWAADGCPGWAFDDVLPYFKKLESFEDGETEFRGGSGPIKVTRPDPIDPISDLFQTACAETTGCGITSDYNAGKQEGVGLFQASCHGGIRQSTSECYLHPNLGRPNLDLVSGALVDRVVIENGRATGVIYRKGGSDHTVSASEVVICAGAVSTPPLLMRSGIGPAAHLRGLGIDVVADLPVGENLHDHLFVPMTFIAPRGTHRGTAGHFFGGMLSHHIKGGGWYGRSVFDVVAFLKLQSSARMPDLQIHVLPWAYPSPNRDNDHERPNVDTRTALTIQPTLIYPKSRGTITMTSKDPTVAPVIDPGYLTDPADTQLLLDGIALCREIMAHASIAPELKLELHPGQDFFDPGAMRRELPNRVATVYHPVGTCRMGSDERAVVDPQLRVRGIEGLRVADASIMPTVTGGNTNAPSIMIGEKAADLIRGA